MNYKDFLLKDMKVGDFFIYLATSGRSPVMKVGRITVLAERDGAYVRGTRVKLPAIKARTAYRSWRNLWVPQGREVTLGVMDKIVIIDKLQVPIEALNVLS